MKNKLLIIAGAVLVTGAAAAGALYYAFPVQVSQVGGLTRNYFITLNAPPGTITVERNDAADARTTDTSQPGPATACV